LLRSDASRTTGVRGKILVGSLATPFVAVIIAVAGIVTPIGLDDVPQLGSQRTVQFAYAADPSSFGLATTIRHRNANFSRSCNSDHGFFQGPAPCPYSDTVVMISRNLITDSTNYYMPYGYNITIPTVLQDVYSSGTRGRPGTVANFFDIEWRQISTDQDQYWQEGSPYDTGVYRQVQSLIQEDAVKVVEGLVVDAKSGGIGFRNHTLPINVGQGAVWVEDLLFIQPETECVTLNLTMDFDVPQNSSELLIGTSYPAYLTDQGAFLHLLHDRPDYDHSNPQQNPDLRRRTARAAWSNNAYTMFVLGLAKPGSSPYPTNDSSPFNSSFIGKRYPIPVSYTSASKNAVGSSQHFGSYFGTSLFGPTNTADFTYPNEFNITTMNFTTIGQCSAPCPCIQNNFVRDY
jgi:hypothetical protein